MSKLKYDESFPERAGEYAAQGLNNTRIARELGIAEDTFYVYLKQFPAFAEAVELGRRAVRDKIDGGMMELAIKFVLKALLRGIAVMFSRACRSEINNDYPFYHSRLQIIQLRSSSKITGTFYCGLRGTSSSAASLQSAAALLLSGEAGISPGYLRIKVPLISSQLLNG